MKSAFTFPVAARRSCLLCLLIMVMSWRSYGQGCDCPSLGSCAPCSGGLTSLTLQYNGALVVVSVTASDDDGALNATLLTGEITITKAGGVVFSGNVDVTVLALPALSESETIVTSCDPPVYEGQEFGNFTVLSGASLGGPLCCSPTEMESIPDPLFTGCPGNQTLPIISGCTRTATWTPPTATDGCGDPVTVTSTHPPNFAFPVGQTEVTYTATDPYGNTNTCEFIITITDGIQPQFVNCPTDRDEPTNANCQFEIPDYAGLVTTTDNCDTDVTVTQSPAIGTILSGSGTTQLITLTATDDSNNIRTCNFTITLADQTAPQITCPGDINVAANHSTNCSYTIQDFTEDATVSDNCDNNITIVQSPLPGIVITGEGTTQVITLTAFDDIGNSNQCTFTITVIDTTLPQITCPPDRNETVDGNCEFEIPDYTGLATATDKCDNAVNVTQSPAPGTLLDGVGTIQMITLTATDNAGNLRNCNFTITLIDETSPLISCPADFDVFTGTTNCSFSIPDYTNLATASDNCDNTVTVIQSPAPGTTMTGHGTTRLITLSAFDISGNSGSCDFTITLKDNVNPQITSCTTNQQVQTDANCKFIVPDYTSMATATDNCDSNVAITQSPAAGTELTGTGTTLFTLTATDDAGNSMTCNFEVTIVDDIDPIIANCPSNITVDAPPSSCGIVVNWPAVTASDNCSTPTLTSNRVSGSTFSVGTTTVTYTATDASGNTATCSFDVIVNDVTLPTITNCPADRSVTLTSGCTSSVTWTAPTATDNCPTGLTFTSTHTPGFAFPLGTTQVIYTATDASGNISTCSFNVTVIDDSDPQIVGCNHGAIQEVTATSSCNAIPVWTPPTATDNCPVTLTSTHNMGDVFPLGKTDVTYTATDQAGNTATCTFKIHVKDMTAPVITGCINSDIIEVANGSCEAIATWIEPVAADNCSVTLTKTHSPGDAFPLGTTIVTYTATDGSGNIATCSFNVVVKDETDPLISGCVSSDVTVNADGSCAASANWIEPTASDNCSVTLTKTHNPGDVFQLGTTVVTYTATDNSGNVATCSFNVIVKDDTNPVISGCISTDIIATTSDESCEAIVKWTPSTASDNCSVTLTSTHNPGDTFQKGTTLVTYTATDGSGNSATCSFNVIVNDETAPEMEETTIPSDLTITANDEGEAIADWTELICTDNCGTVTVTSSHDPGSGFLIGTTEVTYTATDEAGNTTTYSFNVVVEDKTNPVISGCPSSDIIVEANASCETQVNWTAPSSTDNSGTVTLTSSHQPEDAFPLGSTRVTYTATDPSGNTSTCEFNVVVIDETAPVIANCIEDIVVSATASCTAIVNWTEPIATDNCSVALTTSHQPGTVFETGTTEVVYTATDDSGNTTTCQFNVIVKDEAPPVIKDCITADIRATTTESCDVTVSWTPPMAEDCSEVTLTSTHEPGAYFSIGTTEVTYTAEDIHGNSASCKFNVVVEDRTPPVFTNCPEKIIAKADGACNAAASWSLPRATDNCEIADITSTHNPGDIFPMGTTVVKYTATDIYGNISYCEFSVVVENVNPPVIEGCVENIVAKAGESGEVQIDWVPPTATVQCGEVTLTGSHTPGDLFSIGTTTVEYKATDDGGNMSFCTFTVNVSYEEVQFDVVNVLTPDGDGINDEWVLGNIEKFSDNKVVVVDRWGSVIFSATGYNNASIIWKGRNSSGTVVPTGTYFYTIAVRVGPVLQEKRGFIELIQ